MRLLSLAVLSAILAFTPHAMAQSVQDDGIDLSQLDPNDLLGSANDIVLRAPDAQIDALLQAAYDASKSPRDAKVLCALFDPDADRSIGALAAAANRLGPESRQRFSLALTDIGIAGLQNPRQPYDPAAAQQTLKSAAVTAMLLNDGFVAGMVAQGSDAASRDARCRSFGWILDALHDLPLAPRAAATRLLLGDGLATMTTGNAGARTKSR